MGERLIFMGLFKITKTLGKMRVYGCVVCKKT